MNTHERLNQLQIIEKAFFTIPATMRMIEVQTQIVRPNICRYVATLRKQKKIALVKKADCQITNHRAGYYTTDPAQFPPTQKQLNLF